MYNVKNVDCLLKNTSTKPSKYVIKPKLEHFNYDSFRELFCWNQSGFFTIKVCFFHMTRLLLLLLLYNIYIAHYITITHKIYVSILYTCFATFDEMMIMSVCNLIHWVSFSWC